MIIDRFGDVYATAYQLSQHNAIDDFAPTRPAVVSRVGGMSGAFDYYGSNGYPIAPMIVRKNITLIGRPAGTVSGTGTINGWGTGSPFYFSGSGTAWLSEVTIGDVINVDTCTATVITVSSDIFMTVSTNTGMTDGGAFTITRPGTTNAAVEYSIDALHAATIGVGESKLWFLRRDAGTRWAYAKCTSLKTADQVGNVYHLPASIEFMCREGVWYGATQSGTSITQAAGSYVLTNVGNTYANFELTLTSSTGTLTQVVITNTTNGDTFTWAGSATVGQTLIVKTGAYTVTKAGVGAYSGLTYGANQVNWLRLNPGSNTVTIAVTGSTAWSGSMAWWDTYL